MKELLEEIHSLVDLNEVTIYLSKIMNDCRRGVLPYGDGCNAIDALTARAQALIEKDNKENESTSRIETA